MLSPLPRRGGSLIYSGAREVFVAWGPDGQVESPAQTRGINVSCVDVTWLYLQSNCKSEFIVAIQQAVRAAPKACVQENGVPLRPEGPSTCRAGAKSCQHGWTYVENNR